MPCAPARLLRPVDRPGRGRGPRRPRRLRRHAPRDHRRRRRELGGARARARLPVAHPHRAGAQPGRRRAVDLRSRRCWRAAPTCSRCARPARATTSSTSTRAPRPGVIVCNNSGPGREAVAEHALGFMLALAKKIVARRSHDPARGRAGPHAAAQQRAAGQDARASSGVGQIGGRLIELCAPFAMTVLAYDPYLCRRGRGARGATKVELDELLERSDFVHLNCPLTPETEGLMGREQFARMKPTAFFITTARGPVHDEAALYDALVSGAIAGAGIDVFHDEPPDPSHPLLVARQRRRQPAHRGDHGRGDARHRVGDRGAVDHDLRGQGAAPPDQSRGVARLRRPFRCPLRRAPRGARSRDHVDRRPRAPRCASSSTIR